MLAFRAPTLVPAAPAVPLLRPVPDHVPSVQGPMEDRSYGGGHPALDRPPSGSRRECPFLVQDRGDSGEPATGDPEFEDPSHDGGLPLMDLPRDVEPCLGAVGIRRPEDGGR
jgi:hypothetical protein